MTDAAPRPTIADRLYPVTVPLPGLESALTFFHKDALEIIPALRAALKDAGASVTLPLTTDGVRVTLDVAPNHAAGSVPPAPRAVTLRGLPNDTDGQTFTTTQLEQMIDGLDVALTRPRWLPTGAQVLLQGADASAPSDLTAYAQVFTFTPTQQRGFKALVNVNIVKPLSNASVTAPDLNITIDLPVLHEPSPEVAVLKTTQHLLDLLAELAVRPTE